MKDQSEFPSGGIAQGEPGEVDLEAELKARDEFLSAVAHELRNPLNALHLTLEGLIRTQSGNTPLAPEQVVSRVTRASTQVDRLAALIDVLLDVSRISTGRLQLQFEDFDAAAVLSAVVARLKDQASPSQISLSMPPSLIIQGDRARYTQIAGSLLSNAIAFGNQRPIEVRLESDASTIRLKVIDHGIGIADADQQRIFERFQKVAKDSPTIGFGIGLWVTREVVRALDGEIHLTSKLGEGSTFVVELPKLNLVATTAPATK